jgi:uncharacterized protein (TIGR03067 family)
MRKILGRSLVFCILITVCIYCQAVTAVHAQADADQGIKDLQGKWRAVEQQTAGISTPKEVLEKARLEIKDDEYIWLSGGPVDVKSRIRLDPSKSPKEIDFTMLDGPGKGSTFPGIYALEKGQLRICYSHTKDRPKEFKTKRGELRELIVLERVVSPECCAPRICPENCLHLFTGAQVSCGNPRRAAFRGHHLKL